MSLTDQIHAELDRAFWRLSVETSTAAAKGSAVVQGVLGLHREVRVYGPCGHTHVELDPSTSEVHDAGWCEDGYRFSVCAACCCDRYEDIRTEECEQHHNRELQPCWPCSTVHTVATGLGITEEPTGPEGAR